MFDRAGSWEATGTASTTTASATGTATAGCCAWLMNASALATSSSGVVIPGQRGQVVRDSDLGMHEERGAPKQIVSVTNATPRIDCKNCY